MARFFIAELWWFCAGWPTWLTIILCAHILNLLSSKIGSLGSHRRRSSWFIPVLKILKIIFSPRLHKILLFFVPLQNSRKYFFLSLVFFNRNIFILSTRFVRIVHVKFLEDERNEEKNGHKILQAPEDLLGCYQLVTLRKKGKKIQYRSACSF